MTDGQSNGSSAEVEGYVQPSQQQQQQQQQGHPIQFAPPPPAAATASDTASAHGAVNDKSSRWSTRDDVQLCDALIAQKNMGRNTGAAVFTTEAWDEVAEQMKGSEILSGGAVKTVPQCKARWQRLKIEYRIVKHLRQQPGFQWDENTQMVTALAATWDAYISEHKDAQPWRKKSFPCYGRVAFLIEDENGCDPGDAKFKRRWAAHASTHSPSTSQPAKPPRSTQSSKRAMAAAAAAAPPESSGGATPTPTPASSTSVFSVSAPQSGTSMPFATQVVPGVSMTMPLNGGYSAIHQYRLPLTQPNGKRAETPTTDGQSASSKRPRSDATANAAHTSTTPQPQPHPQAPQPDPYTTYPPQAYAQPPVPGQPIYYASPPPPGAVPAPVQSAPGMPIPTPAPAVPPPPSANNIASRLAVAIQSVEESEGLSDADFVKTVQLFQRRTEAADAYLAIQSKRARTMYLRAELDDFGRS